MEFGSLGAPENRTRVYTVALALGVLASLPIPTPREAAAWNVIVLALWVGIAALAWCAWFRRDLLDLVWLATFVMAFAGALVAFSSWRPAILLAIWRFYLARRRLFDAKTQGLRAVFLALAVLAGSVQAKTPARPESVLPRHLVGYRVNEVTSCGPVFMIPWKFRPDRRSVRLLMKDEMSLNSETSMSLWEIHQVMDAKGYVAFIFRRQLKDGGTESIVTKDAVYNRILELPKRKPKVVEAVDLRPHINRPVLTFTTKAGAMVTFEPGSAGSSQVTIQHAPPPEGGRYLPPVYIRGNYCTRPDSDSDDKADPQKANATPTAPAAVPAGGSK